MRINESRGKHSAIGFDGGLARRQVIRLQGDDSAPGDAHIEGLVRVFEPNMVNRQVHGFFPCCLCGTYFV